jgi:hypothetical protein
MVGGRADLLSQIDAVTVRLLQSRAPGVSEWDLSFLRRKQNRLFRYIDCQRERDAIWHRIEQIQLPIPTLKTFFQDILFLDVGQSVMRQLCRSPLTGARSIDEALEEQFIVDSGGSVSDLPRIPGSRFQFGLWDLWRFSLQFAFEMTTQKDHHRRVPRKMEDIERAQEFGLHEIHPTEMAPSLRLLFFGLARSYGIHPPVSDDLETATLEIPLPVPSDFPPEQDKDIDLERRCGKPFTDSIEADRYALSFESISRPTAATRVSAVLVRQSVFCAFFGYLLPQETASQDASRSGQVYDGGVTAGSESFYQGPDSREIEHPSPVRAPRRTPADFDPLQPSSNPNLVGPVSHSEQSYSVQITHFRFEIAIFRTERVILLPNNRDALNAFFEQLNEYEFHFYFSPDEEGHLSRQEYRTIPYMECYPLYINFPFSTLRAVYCQGCPIHPVHSPGHIMAGQTNSREELADIVRTLVQTAIDLVLNARAGAFAYTGF